MPQCLLCAGRRASVCVARIVSEEASDHENTITALRAVGLLFYTILCYTILYYPILAHSNSF